MQAVMEAASKVRAVGSRIRGERMAERFMRAGTPKSDRLSLKCLRSK